VRGEYLAQGTALYDLCRPCFTESPIARSSDVACSHRDGPPRTDGLGTCTSATKRYRPACTLHRASEQILWEIAFPGLMQRLHQTSSSQIWRNFQMLLIRPFHMLQFNFKWLLPSLSSLFGAKLFRHRS
jgi:hypothetical protein